MDHYRGQPQGYQDTDLGGHGPTDGCGCSALGAREPSFGEQRAPAEEHGVADGGYKLPEEDEPVVLRAYWGRGGCVCGGGGGGGGGGHNGVLYQTYRPFQVG